MLYGYAAPIDEIATLVIAATDNDEFEQWKANVEQKFFTKSVAFSFMDLLTTKWLKGYDQRVVVFYHDNTLQRDAFIKHNNINVIVAASGPDHFQEMLANQKIKENPSLADKFKNEYLYAHGNRSIGEIHGLSDTNDKWDRRTPEEKEQDRSAAFANGKNKDTIMGESFTFDQSGKGADGMQLTNINQVGNNISVSAIKHSKKTTTIQISEQKMQELDQLKAKVSPDIFQEKYAEAFVDAGLTSLGLSNSQKEQVFGVANNASVEYGQIISMIENGDFEFDKFLEQYQGKTGASLSDSSVDLASRGMKLMSDLRAAGFSDEIATNIIESIDSTGFLSQEEYIKECERVVNEKIADKKQKDIALEMHKKGQAYSVNRRQRTNPFNAVLKPIEVDNATSTGKDNVDDEAKDVADDILKNIFGNDDED